jgi:chromate reductase, NAD(P)H dehydrogenase (quinone)
LFPRLVARREEIFHKGLNLRLAMTDTLKVISICGSLRKGSYNAALARTLPGLAPPGISIKAAPPWETIPIYNADIQSAGFPPAVTDWANAIRSADGVIIVSPEYNWSIPGGLKNAIDWVSRMKDQPFQDKPVALQSASGALLGGSRMQYHLRQSLTSIEAVILIRPEVFVTFAPKKFDEKTLALTDPPTLDMVKAQLVAFEKFVRKVSGNR